MGNVDASALRTLQESFPEFRSDVRLGPDAGGAGERRQVTLDRAAFASRLAGAAIDAIDEISNRILARACLLSRAKVILAGVGGISGAAMLTAFGVSSEEVARLCALTTSCLAVVNGAFEAMARRYAGAEVHRAAELKKAGYGLGILRNEVDSLLARNGSIAQIQEAAKRCNELAMES